MNSPLKNIPALTMPSDDELRAGSLRWFERTGPTLIDRWPADLAALSMPTKFIRFPIEAMEPLFEPKDEVPEPVIIELANEIDAAIGWRRSFVRLNSRSPKDATWPYEAPATLSGKEAIVMFGGSMRVLDDLCWFRRIPEHPAYICVREWVYGFDTSQEYRCFVKDGEMIAVTHYDYTKPHRAPEDGGRQLRERINAWFAEVLSPRLPIKTVVFDIYEQRDGSFLLIEINPYGLSDPCHFQSYERVESAQSYIEYATAAKPHG